MPEKLYVAGPLSYFIINLLIRKQAEKAKSCSSMWEMVCVCDVEFDCVMLCVMVCLMLCMMLCMM